MAKAKQLEYASRRLTATEINAACYELRTPETFERWAKMAPGGFRFAVKASLFRTNRKVLDEGDQTQRLHYAAITTTFRRAPRRIWVSI